jgi:hypothetical protein
MFKRKKQSGSDFFKDAVDERRAIEDDQPWFLADDDEPELDVEAGRSARMDPKGEPGS